jgi:replicative DNA helicase
MKHFSIADQFTDARAEEQLLATIYNNPETFYEVIDLVPVGIWTYYQNDFRSVAEAITTEQPLPKLELKQPPVLDPEPLAKYLSDLYQKRMAAILLESSLEKLHNGDMPAKEVISGIEQGLVEVQNSIREVQMGQLVNVPSLFDDLLQELSERHKAVKEKGQAAVGLITEIPTLDKLLGGFQTGIHLLAAEPGQGKTTFALQVARTVAKRGFPAIFVSFEESLDRLVLKCLCSAAGLNIKRYAEGWGDPLELQPAIEQYGPQMRNLHLIQGTKNLTVSQLKAKALQLMQRTGTDKCMIIVDYLQRWAAFQREEGFADFRHTVRELVGELRELSLRLKSPVLVISSQNRMGQGTSRLSSLKESGDLEYDADSALFLTKSEERMGTGSVRMVDLHIEKNRYGDKGRVDLVFRPEFGLFREED